jgi:hypothetical protein
MIKSEKIGEDRKECKDGQGRQDRTGETADPGKI